jgi:outer membrane protein assembly factor BamA
MRICVTPLVLALCALAAPAAAQTGTDRQDEALAARAEKAERITPYVPGGIERLLNTIENSPTVKRTFAPHDGLGLRIGGIDAGSPVAVGASWRRSTIAGGNLHLHASGAVSVAADTELEAGFRVPHAGTRRLAFDVGVTATQLANERFFGLGAGTLKADETAFAIERRHVAARATLTPAGWLTVAGSAGMLSAFAGDAEGRRAPAVSTLFLPAQAPGVGTDTRFTIFSLGATVDYRRVPMNPRSGGRYHLDVSRYIDRSATAHSFTRFDAEVEQHLSAWKRQRVLTLRAIASSLVADRGHIVPFYLQPTLGGSRLLRGFVTDRFRDRDLLALQVEYGWDVTPFVNAVVFYEAGTVAARWADIDVDRFEKDYGIGFRFGGSRTVAFRTDVALGSGEGTRFTVRMNHAF